MPKYNNPRRTWKYSNDFKVNAIQLSYVVGVTIKSVAEKIDIHPFMLSRWRKEYREGIIVADKRKKVAGQSKTKKILIKEQQLERENKVLKEELYILKKWQRFLAQEHQPISIHRNTQSRHKGHEITEVLYVSKSGYYDWRERQPSARTIEDGELKQKIQRIFTENKGRYGSPRIFKALQKQGYNIGKKRVELLYRALGLVARVMRVTARSAFYKRFLTTGKNLRPDGEVPLAKDKVWVADVTYLKVKGVWRYLSVIMDLYSRRIISRSLDKSRTMEVTKRTLQNAVKKRKPSGDLMLHTDRGVEYRGHIYQKALKRHGITHSLSRAGKCTDNAHMESFFHSMKTEVIRGNVFKIDKELRGTLGSYINKYYNVSRMHSGINYCSPIEYEALAA